MMGKARKISEKRPQRLRGGYPLSPGRGTRVRKALFEVQQKKLSLRDASKQYGFSFGFLQRRLSGEVEVDKRKGPRPVFNKEEEVAMATWLREMAERGMGLKPQEFLDFVQGVVRKEGKPNNFKDGRPGHDWYYAFMARNAEVVEPRKETPLEMCRAKVNKTKLDTWFVNFRQFLSNHDLLDKPKRIWNADETGFSMGSVPGRVIGPLKSNGHKVPHVSGGHSKQRHTVMFCGNASGDIIPPYFVYPEPKPKGYNPMTGGIDGSKVSYTKKGWMDTATFKTFLSHFDEHAGTDRPVVLLVDGVSSHVDLSVFQDARGRGIELYRLVANATHLMQPLDKGVFGPLKTRWHQVVRKHTRENPGCPIGKQTFAEKLKEAFLLFYKPLTVINSFRSSGTYLQQHLPWTHWIH